MDNPELPAEDQILILTFLKKWLIGFSSVAILVFGGVGAILISSIQSIGASTAASAARIEVQNQIDRIDRHTEALKESTNSAENRYNANVRELDEYRRRTSTTINDARTQLELSRQELEFFLRDLEDSSDALTKAKALTKDVSSISIALSNDTNFVSQVSANLGSVPVGAVLAFSTKCPSPGWEEYIEARGRVIVGSGQGPGLTDRKHGASGGSETYEIRGTDLPKHIHSYGDWHYNDQLPKNNNYATAKGDDSGSRDEIVRQTIDKSGPDILTIPVMQPFLSLRYCVKTES